MTLSAAANLPAWLDRQAYPFKLAQYHGRDGQQSYVDHGQGRPLVFAHGTPTWSFEYRHLISGLSTKRRCLALDHLGFGLSARPTAADYSPEAHSRRFLAWLDTLNLEDYDLLAHDFGGPIALPAALRAERRPRRLILLNTWAWSFADDPEMQKRARLVAGGFGKFCYRRLNFSLRVLMPSAYSDRRKLTQAIHKQYLAPFANIDDRERVLFALARSLSQSAPYFDSLWQQRQRLADLPCLIVWGLKDHAFRPHNLARWRQALPQAQVLELANAGHWPHEEEPQATLAAVQAFLADC